MDASVPGYVLGERLGGGARTVVHRGEELATGRAVAVKRPVPGDPEAAAALRREAGVLGRVEHPHLVRLLDVVETTDGPALVLPLAATTLDRRLAAEGPLPADEVAELGTALAGALAAVHASGVTHRDVKPPNVLFDHEGLAVLGDLGAAADVSPADVVGTAEYLDPEVASGAAPGPRSDVYALGVTLYEALTGVPPYAGSTVEATLRAADRGLAVPLGEAAPDAPPALRAAIARAMARDPQARHGSARELARDLAGARLGTSASPGAPTSPGERSGGTRHFGPRPPAPPSAPADAEPARRSWLLAGLVAAVAVPVLALVLVPRLTGDPAPVAPTPVSTTAGAVTPAPPPPPCSDAVAPSERPGERVLTGDLTGAGCSTYAIWSAGVLEVPRGAGEPADRFRMGEEGDVPVLGDWDCDGADTPAVYRPSTGEVFLFDGFAGEDGELTSRPGYASGRRDGRPVVADLDGDGCDEVVVTPAGA